MSIDYDEDVEKKETVKFESEFESELGLQLDLQEPGDDAIVEIQRRHYDQALSFYFDDYQNKGTCKKLNKYSSQLYKVFSEFKYIKTDLIFQEIWNDVVIYKTAGIFSRKEKLIELNGILSVDNLIMDTMKWWIRKVIIKQKNKESRFELFYIIEKDIKQKIDQNCPHLEGLFDTNPIEGDSPYVIIDKFIFEWLKINVSPVYLKIYELTVIKAMPDKEIIKLIRMPLHSFKNIRRRITNLLRENKFEILTELNLTEDNFGDYLMSRETSK